MTRFLLATDSVHTSAAACDYLQTRAEPDDEVVVVAVREHSERDAADAANVVSVRLVEPDVEVVEREGDPVEEILACADEQDVDEGATGANAAGADELLVGPHSDPPGTERMGGTARRIVARADLPVVVVPLA